MTEPTAGGLPQDAMTRLSELQPGKPGSIFTSDLTVNEFLLVKQAGFTPVGMVLGSSIYHVGIQVGRWSQNQELDVLSQAMYHARELAMSRMEQEANVLGADGIVGVRLEVEFKEWGADIAEFLAVGTAVKADDGTSWRNDKGLPFTSDLSGQDFWTLVQTGYAPLGMVMGTCVYHIAHRGLGNVLSNVGRNTELTQFTQALYDARELAMERMQKEAEELHAEGIVGVQLHQRNHSWGAHTTEFFSIGTAVRPLRADHVITPPSMVVSLDNYARQLTVVTSTAITQDASPRRRNVDAIALAAPILTLLVVAIIRKGAFFRPDIVVSPALTLALAFSVQQVRDWARDHLAAVAAGLLGTAWWIGDAELTHHSVDSWRLPAAWLCLAAGYGCARGLSEPRARVALIGTAVDGRPARRLQDLCWSASDRHRGPCKTNARCDSPGHSPTRARSGCSW